jgi:hypothetical protein
LLISCAGLGHIKQWLYLLQHFRLILWSGSDENTSGHGGGIGVLGEVDGDCARAAGAGSRDVGNVSGGSSVEKIASEKAGKGCVLGCAWLRWWSLWRRQQLCM